VDEKEYYSDIWGNQVVTNVARPTMQLFEPKNPNGTSVIIAPGGGLYALSINSEGTEVAKWLNEKGITAFVLKYRLVPTGVDGVYPWTTVLPVQSAPKDAPPMLVICASDDPLGLASGSIELYSSWLKVQKPVGLHMYAKGGHGFGMKKQDLPADNWIQLFYDWAIAENIIGKKASK